jgi:hypothetical protein
MKLEIIIFTCRDPSSAIWNPIIYHASKYGKQWSLSFYQGTTKWGKWDTLIVLP